MVIRVEMGEGAVSEAPDVITTVGCGSCVVVMLYDAKKKVGGLAHVMLPDLPRIGTVPDLVGQASCLSSQAGSLCHQVESGLSSSRIYQYASTAIPALLDDMQKRGCSRRDITAKMAGGARMFSTYAEFPAGIGEQNVKSVRQLLEREQIPLTGFDIGGRHGRSMEFYIDSGWVIVKAFGREDREI